MPSSASRSATRNSRVPGAPFLSATGIAWLSSSQASQVYEPNAETVPAPLADS